MGARERAGRFRRVKTRLAKLTANDGVVKAEIAIKLQSDDTSMTSERLREVLTYMARGVGHLCEQTPHTDFGIDNMDVSIE